MHHELKEQAPGQAPNILHEQLVALYTALDGLQSARSQYIQAIDFLISARALKLPSSILKIRSDQVVSEAVNMSRSLARLDAAMVPLNLPLDLKNPKVGLTVKHYEQKQKRYVEPLKKPEMVGSFTPKELEGMKQDIKKNGEELEDALTQLKVLIMEKYPTN